ncbi:MAG: hypothetical protein J6T24_08215, partial [Clostridia bacterium]|nr:hypothetical protein [Clostridia bacterium]
DIWYYGSCYSGWEFGYYNIALETEGQGWAHNADGTPWVSGSDETPYLGYPKGDGYYSLKSVQPNSSGAMASGNSAAGRNTYILFNAVEALDAPGEWFLDRDTDILYVYPTEEMEGSTMSTSGSTSVTLLGFKYVNNLVIDGINVDGANGIGFEFSYCENVVVQNVECRNTRSSAIYFRECYDSAVLYSDFSRANSALISIAASESTRTLTPSGMVIQNCAFHDPLPTQQGGISYAGYRTVISHNYLENTIISGNVTAECIVEYNLLEGGSSDITDGGMIYTWGWSNRGNHYRYNVVHMFNATHKAIYNDGTSSGHYTYGNIVSFIGSKSSRNLGWYSSTGMGNVCVGNIFILRNPYQVAAANSPDGDEENNILPANAGDMLNESALFYYYFGEEYAGTGAERRYYPVAYDGTQQQSGYLTQSEAGHWWYDMKWDEYNHYTAYNEAGWRETSPAFMNMMYGTQIILAAYDDPNCDYHPKYFYVPWYLTGKTFTYDGLAADTVVEIPQYTYLDASGKKVVEEAHIAERNDDGSITLTYEELAAMERFRRQPAVCVIEDNVILGGTPTTAGGKFTDISDPKLNVVDSAEGFTNYVPTASVENNYFEYHYEEIIFDAEQHNYDLLPGALEAFADVLTRDGYAIIESIDWTEAGLLYRYPYLSGTR